MKTLLIYLSLLYLFLLSGDSIAQQRKSDSLETLLLTAKEDTNKVMILNDISWNYKNMGEFSKAMKHAEDALNLSKKINYKKGAARAYNNLGTIYYEKSDLPFALKYYLLCTEAFEEINERTGLASTYNNIGNVYCDLSNYTLALEYYLKSLRMKEEIGDQKGIAASYSNIGLVYDYQNNDSLALEFYFKAEKMYEEKNNKRGLNIIYNNVGTIYQEQGLYLKAIEYYRKSLKIKEELDDKKGVAFTYINIGSTYIQVSELDGNRLFRLFPSKKQGYSNSIKTFLLDSARNYFFRALDINKELRDGYTQTSALMGLGKLSQQIQRWKEAVDYFEQAVVIADSIGNKLELYECYKSIAEIYYNVKNYEQAYNYHQLYAQIKDTVFNQTSSKQIAEMQTIYETDKKEKEIALQKSELEKKGVEIKHQTTQKLAFAGGFGLILLFALVVFRSYKQKQKANLLLSQQKQEIETKNSELENANVVIHQKSELLQESLKDITDSITYGSYIQQAILPEPDLFNRLFPDAFILYKPRDIVSGDFYQVAENDESVYLLTADCTGHGVPGAFMSILGATLFNDALHLQRPDLILAEMRNGIVKALKQNTEIGGRKEGMDCSLIRIYRNKRIMEAAAANNSIYISQGAKLVKLSLDSMPVGISDYGSHPFAMISIQLEPDDVIYTLTDGYQDQFGGQKGKKFKASRLKELLAGIANRPIDEQKVLLEKSISEWMGSNSQVDDISVIGLKM